jgi:mono/diheme cytochrome c family protein
MDHPPPPSRRLIGVAVAVVAAVALFAGCAPSPPPPTTTPVASATGRATSPLTTAEPSAGTTGATPAAAITWIEGTVRNVAGPVAGAIVRVQATTAAATTGPDGRFRLTGLVPGRVVRLSAWAGGYLIAGGEEHWPGQTVTFELVPVPSTDTSGYAWLPAAGAEGEGEASACVVCHAAAGTGLAASLPYDQWRLDAHAGSAVNPRFLSMYAGTDLAGRQSPLTRYTVHADYGRIPLRPDPSVPYHGPGYRLDFPDAAGNCATCHVPAAAADDPYGVDVRSVGGVAAEGVTCDVCHKVWDVRLDPSTGKPDPGLPGVLSIELRRPPEGRQLFTGPYDDVAPGQDTFSPLQRESRFCAPCHSGTFWDTQVYDSYGEWLASPYSDATTGRTCQACHMPATGATVFARPDKGGLTRDPATIPGHAMPGAASEALLRSAVTMTATVTRDGERIAVRVTIVNDRTGHHVPTDSPLRQMILLVEATGTDGNALAQLEGPILPAWTGTRSAPGHYAGRPGTAYAKILEELWTEIWPTGAYWNQTRVRSDNRIPAFGRDETSYAFRVPPGQAAKVTVRLLYRRAYIELAEQKGWLIPDIVMAETEIPVAD